MKKLISIIISVIMIASCVTVVSAAKTGFSDVAEDRWSAASIKYAVDNGYMKGVGGDKFDPEGSLTRAMVATVLWRREGSPAPTAPSGFSDVPAGEWYTDAVAWAKETGVVKGITATTFEPDGKITREQLATMLFRFSSSAPVSVPERADLTPFSDDEKVSDWANEPLEWAVEAGLIKGTDGNRLAPEGDATREQFAAIIERYDGTFILKYNRPVVRSHYTEKEYPLVDDADFYVATDGDDGNDGSFDHPFRTWDRAIEAVRGVEKTPEKGGVTVAFKAGTYRSVHVELTAEDSGTPECPVTYCKYGDGDVVFDNGVVIPAEDFRELDEAEKALFNKNKVDNIRKVDLTDYLSEIPAYDDLVIFGDDSILTAARYPNLYPDGSDSFIEAGRTNSDTSLLISNRILVRKLSSYPAEVIPEMRVYGNIIRGYRKDTFQAKSYDPETGVLEILDYQKSEFGKMREGWQGTDGTGIPLCVLNVPGELDVNGEFWVDRSTGTLYVYDPKGEYSIPGAAGPLELRGVSYDAGDGLPAVPEYVMMDFRNTGYLTLRGLSFRRAIGGFLFAFRTSGVTIDRCSFAYSTGRNHCLIQYSLDDAPMAFSITDSEFDFSVGCSVYFLDSANGPDRYTNISDIFVDNCLFRRTNLQYDVEGALNLFQCTKGLVSHNDFVGCHRYGVMFDYSCDVVVEYNNFDSAMTNSEDGGVIRTALGMDSNAVVRYNLVNTVPDGTVGRFAQYSDLGDCGTTDMNNLFYDAGPVLFAGAGRDNKVVDNYFVTGSSVDVRSHIPEILEAGEEARSIFPINVHISNWNRILNYCSTVPGYREELEKRRPGASTFSFDLLNPENENFFLAPVTTVTGNVFFNRDDEVRVYAVNEEYLHADGNEAHDLTENPYFVNPTIGDYRIKEGADCPYFPFEEIGRY
ncbi:MAG: S-layer homology domain-containing protein [Clostridia bacterium]|nr:S-layer homology domain-containing protein [Clostridia bacterium]